MLEKFKKNALSSEQMKNVKGGYDSWTCYCDSGGGFQGAGTSSDMQEMTSIYCGGEATCYVNSNIP